MLMVPLYRTLRPKDKTIKLIIKNPIITSSTESGRVRSSTSGRKNAQKAPKIPKKPKIMYGNTGLITANMKITGAMIPPIRATAEQYPIPTFLNIKIEISVKLINIGNFQTPRLRIGGFSRYVEIFNTVPHHSWK